MRVGTGELVGVLLLALLVWLAVGFGGPPRAGAGPACTAETCGPDATCDELRAAIGLLSAPGARSQADVRVVRSAPIEVEVAGRLYPGLQLQPSASEACRCVVVASRDVVCACWEESY